MASAINKITVVNPLVSIVLTSYNQPELLEKAFHSLINQTYKNIEIIIVDDYSTDAGNRLLIENFKAEFPGKVLSFYQNQNVGIPKNKNTGFRLANGEYITYLDGDDTYYDNKISCEIEVFSKHPDVDVVYSNFDIKDLNGKVLSIWATKTPAQGYIFKDIILHNFPDCHTHRNEMFKRNVLTDLNFYDEQLTMYEDLDLMLRYSQKYKVAYCCNTGCSYYKNPKSIVSGTKGLKLIEEQEKVYKKYNNIIEKHNLVKPFKKYMNELQFNKLFYLDKPDFDLLLNAFLKYPNRILKIARITNYLLKKNKATGR